MSTREALLHIRAIVDAALRESDSVYLAVLHNATVNAYGANGLTPPDSLGRVRWRVADELRAECGERLKAVNAYVPELFYLVDARPKASGADPTGEGVQQWELNTQTAHTYWKHNQAYLFKRNASNQMEATTAMLPEFGFERTAAYSDPLDVAEAKLRAMVAERLKDASGGNFGWVPGEKL